ncbi:MAG: hypothetical protein C4560_12785 [Nitrospiraceae bacterium]|nr:MAG: hypothetical protein C4560_12785 [Nitrospiraceae bacterium]
MPGKIPGYGGKRPQLKIEVDRLHLDAENPRLPESIQGQKEATILQELFEEFNLEEISDSISQNGYFDEEPLVAIPLGLTAKLLRKSESENYDAFIHKKTTQFTVVEGNRRLATIKILLDKGTQNSLGIRSWPEISKEVREDISKLPVIVYPERKEVIPYLGVRHITGIKKWDAYAKARYIIHMIESGLSIENIELRIGDKQGSGRKNVICYKMIKQAHEEFDYDVSLATQYFSYLMLSIGQLPIRNYLGMGKLKEISLDEPIPNTKIEELKNLLSWLFGEDKNRKPVIDDSREITQYLTHVVKSPEAVEYLNKTRRLQDAYELTDGEETMLKKTLSSAGFKLEKALGIIHRHKTLEIKAEVEKCFETANRLRKTINE